MGHPGKKNQFGIFLSGVASVLVPLAFQLFEDFTSLTTDFIVELFGTGDHSGRVFGEATFEPWQE